MYLHKLIGLLCTHPYKIHIRVYTAVYTLYKPNSAVVYANFQRTQKAYTAAVGVAGILIFAAVTRIQQGLSPYGSMLSSQATQQSESAAASQASSSTKSSADHRKYYDLLVKRREAALKPGSNSKTAAWWKFFEVLLVTDPVTISATNVLLKCLLCHQELSSSNTSRIAESHLAKGGCSKIKSNADVAA